MHFTMGNYITYIEDCMRLIELQKMMSRSNSNQFYIPESKMEHFVAKVVPGLMKLGTVH